LNFQSSRARNRDWLAHVISLPFSVVAVSSCVRPCSRLRELVEQKIGVTHVGADAVLMHLGRRSECPALVLGEIRHANFRLGRGTAPNKLLFGFPPECFPNCFPSPQVGRPDCHPRNDTARALGLMLTSPLHNLQRHAADPNTLWERPTSLVIHRSPWARFFGLETASNPRKSTCSLRLVGSLLSDVAINYCFHRVCLKHFL
jgi:hypothetical protein